MLAKTLSSETYLTKHMTANHFADAFAAAAPGTSISYALGDLAFSAPMGAELLSLRSLVRRYYCDGRGHLTQRRHPEAKLRGHASFEYIFTVAAPPWHGRVGVDR